MMEVAYTTNLRLIRLLDNEFISSDCEVVLHFEVKENNDAQLQENIIKSMQLWLHDFVDHGIVYFPGTSIDTTVFESVTNNIIHTPDQPDDYHMCVLLHSKLNAIGQGVVVIKKTEFCADTSSGFKCSVNGTVDEWLPSNTDWMGEHTFFDQPWWNRPDGGTFDLPYTQGDDVGHVRDMLTIDLIKLVSAEVTDTPVKHAEIIKPAFKPKIITNDD